MKGWRPDDQAAAVHAAQACAVGARLRVLASRLEGLGFDAEAIGTAVLGYGVHLAVALQGRSAAALWLREAADALEAGETAEREREH